MCLSFLALLLSACTPDDLDGDGVPAPTDCNDSDPTVHPGAGEVCDGVDQDCDGLVDNDAADASTWAYDDDGDGFGATTSEVTSCTRPDGFIDVGGDCDDTDLDVHPGAGEVCDGRDQDCDGAPDNGVQTTFYADLDGDGFGDPAAPVEACTLPAGASENADDCDDTQPSALPGGVEVPADGIDQDCSGGDTCWVDEDGDGDGGTGAAVSADMDCTDAGESYSHDDCDDTDPSVAAAWPAPVAMEASTEYDESFVVSHLFDAVVCPSDVGVTRYGYWGWTDPYHEDTDQQYASAGWIDGKDAAVFLDFGASIASDTLLFANRNSDYPGDHAETLRVWFGDTDFAGELPTRDPDAVLALNPDLDGDWDCTDATLTAFDLGACHAGRYVAMELIGAEGWKESLNLGASELRLAPCE